MPDPFTTEVASSGLWGGCLHAHELIGLVTLCWLIVEGDAPRASKLATAGTRSKKRVVLASAGFETTRFGWPGSDYSSIRAVSAGSFLTAGEGGYDIAHC